MFYTPEQIDKELRRLSNKLCCIIANPAGGEGFLPLTGTGTATGNIIGDLDGNILSVQQGTNNLLFIDPTPGAEVTGIQAYNTTDNDNISAVSLATDNLSASLFLGANFNDGVKIATIEGSATSLASSLVYTADTHTFTGNFKLDSANDWDLDSNILTIGQGGNYFLGIDPTPNNEAVAIRAFNTTDDDNYSLLVLGASDTTAFFDIAADFNDGVKRASIGANADNTSSYLQYNADIHTFTGAVAFHTTTIPPEYADDTAATGGGLTCGDIYRTGSVLKVVFTC